MFKTFNYKNIVLKLLPKPNNENDYDFCPVTKEGIFEREVLYITHSHTQFDFCRERGKEIKSEEIDYKVTKLTVPC